jgi:hypothetical protein
MISYMLGNTWIKFYGFRLSTFDKKTWIEKEQPRIKKIKYYLLKLRRILSPTMYDDYAISETLFHWQSHNAYGPETNKGLSYINHRYK